MKKQQLIELSAWFSSFVAGFQAESASGQRNYDLKVEHTLRVREVMARLTASLELTPEERTLAAAIAICHDIGRFPQYRDFGTFNDASSINHAALSVQTLKSEGILDALDSDQRCLLLQAVALHNAFTLPDDLHPVARRFALLIRDADKLDIWRVMIEYCAAPPEERASAVIWELPDTGECSKFALEEVTAGRMLNRSLLATADDFKLLQLSWVFDLHFAESFAMVSELGYLETLASLLPCQPECREAAAAVRCFVRSKCG